LLFANLVDAATRKKVKVEPEKKDAGKAKAQIVESKKRIEATRVTHRLFTTRLLVVNKSLRSVFQLLLENLKDAVKKP
jgi:hypothetical protein